MNLNNAFGLFLCWVIYEVVLMADGANAKALLLTAVATIASLIFKRFNS